MSSDYQPVDDGTITIGITYCERKSDKPEKFSFSLF